MARVPAPVSSAVTAQADAATDAAVAGRKPGAAARQPPPDAGAAASAASRTVAAGQKVSQTAPEASNSRRKLPVAGASQEAKEKTMAENNRNKMAQKKTAARSEFRTPDAAAAARAAAACLPTVKSAAGSKTTAERSKTVEEGGGNSSNSKSGNSTSSTTTGTSSGKGRGAAPSSRSSDALYALLGVSKDATSAEIGKAYRALALLLHPDKVLHRVQQQQKEQEQQNASGDGNETRKKHPKAEKKEAVPEHATEKSIEEMRREATRHFQELQRAYAILKDPAKRKLYDKTGLTGEDGEEPQSFEEAYAFYRNLFPEIDLCAIEKFRKKYLGSEAERDDIREFCEKFNGDLSHFFAYIPFSEKEHLPRYVKILTEIVEKKELPHATKLTKKAIEHLEQQAEKMEKFTAREAGQLQTQKSSSSNEKPSKKRKEADLDGLQALALAIQTNANKRAKEGNSFLEQLAQKYGGERGARGGRRSRGK